MASSAFTCKELWTLSTRETKVFTVDFTDELASGETLTAISGDVTVNATTVTLGVSAPTGIAAGTPTINSGTVTVGSETIAVGKCVQVRLYATGGTVGKQYAIRVTAQTSDSNVIEAYCTLEVLG